MGKGNEWQMIVDLYQCRKTACVVSFDTAKHFIIPIKTLFV